jgi:hypothetical protein
VLVTLKILEKISKQYETGDVRDRGMSALETTVSSYWFLSFWQSMCRNAVARD